MSTSGLYGNTTNAGGTYFEWFIFKNTGSIPTTPTLGSWNFTTNVGTPPTGWSNSPPVVTATTTWASVAIVDSRNPSTFTWSYPIVWANAGAGLGTVTNVGVATGNGFSGTVLNPTATPNITIGTSVTGLLKGNGTGVVAATAGTDYVPVTAANGSAYIPVGTTAQRDASPISGYVRYNLTLGQFEAYSGSSWNAFAAIALTEVKTATEGQTTFVLSYTPISTGLLQVFLNGVRLSPSTDYTIIATSLTLGVGATLSDELLVDYLHV